MTNDEPASEIPALVEASCLGTAPRSPGLPSRWNVERETQRCLSRPRAGLLLQVDDAYAFVDDRSRSGMRRFLAERARRVPIDASRLALWIPYT
jgi:hypothetical protein